MADKPASHEEMLSALREFRQICLTRPLQGERFALPRPGQDAVDTILYRPVEPFDRQLPVIFNLHGGAWVAGDAVLMDSFCQLLATRLPALVVNVNYRKSDTHPFPYAVTELTDAISYMAGKSAEFGIDAAKMAVCGFSAGANIAAGTAVRLAEEGQIALAAQILVYPCVDMTIGGDLAGILGLYCRQGEFAHPWASPLLLSLEKLAAVTPALIVTCELDELRPQGEAYAKKLIDAGVPVMIRQYKNALHGFIEVSRPDYFTPDERKTPEQDALARQCETDLLACIRMLL